MRRTMVATLLLAMQRCDAFQLPVATTPPLPLTASGSSRWAPRCCELPSEPPSAPPEMTEVGSKKYYEGFFTQPIDESVTAERGDGTEQAIKFAATSGGIIVLLFLGFMASNGLLG